MLNCPENKQKQGWWQVCSRLLVKTSAGLMLTASLPAFSANQQYSLPFWLDGELVLRSNQQFMSNTKGSWLNSALSIATKTDGDAISISGVSPLS